MASIAKRKAPECIVFVDNCYGEFVEQEEPVQRPGVDLMAGSLIKNPGGGIAPTGGYIAGRHDLVEQCAYRLTTPGTGREIGCTLGHNRELFPGGLPRPPRGRGKRLKTAVFAAHLFAKLGYGVTPGAGGGPPRHHPGHRAAKAGGPDRLLQRGAEGGPGGFLRGAGAQPHAWLRL